MRFSVLALDYDGTIAQDGALNERVRAAIKEVRSHGIAVVLVTGRILRDLQQRLNDLRLFDVVVAENGAVVLHPHSGRSILLGQPPPSFFFERLQAHGISVLAGECIIEAEASEAARILPLIKESELALVMAFKRNRVMILPQAISKATGLREVLTAMRASVHNTLAIGDAENDHELLAACEMGVAVGWGSPQLKAAADMVLEGPDPGTVADYITRIAASLRLPQRRRKRHLLVGYE
jgi:hydroxymethylpyrimidine pyrophosphatase-like HAD family hydrolase